MGGCVGSVVQIEGLTCGLMEGIKLVVQVLEIQAVGHEGNLAPGDSK